MSPNTPDPSKLSLQPCQGARPGMRVAFLYAKRPAARLVELVQYPATTRS